MLSPFLLLLLAPIQPAAAKVFLAERYDVRIQVQPDASLRVTETVRFRFLAEPFSFVSREIAKRGTDRIFDLAATMDGAPVELEVDHNRTRVRAVWHFNAAADTTHQFTLVYRVQGAISRQPGADRLRWNAIPERHPYTILAGQIVLEYPEGVSLVSPASVASATHTAHYRGRSVFTLPVLQEHRSTSLAADFTPGLVAAPPRWQAEGTETGEQDPAKVAWNSALLTAGGGIVAGILGWMLLAGDIRKAPAIPAPEGMRPADPGFAPAIAGRLIGRLNGQSGPIATFFDLARQGVLRLRATGLDIGGKQNHQIEVLASSRPLLPFEALVFETAATSMFFPMFLMRLPSMQARFEELLESHMLSMGLLDAGRIAAKRAWRRRMLWLLLGGLLLGIAGIVLSVRASHAGESSATAGMVAGIGMAAFVLAVAGLIRVATVSTLTPLGAACAGTPQACYKDLLAIARGRQEAAPEAFAPWLPFAVAAGLGAFWFQRFRAQAAALPAWLDTTADGSSGMDFFDYAIPSNSGSDSSSSSDSGSSSCDSGSSGGGSSDAG